DWGKREDVIRYFLGDVVVWDDSGTLKVSRLLPQRLPDRPEMAAVSVKRLTGHRFLGTVDDRGSPIYERAEIEFQFENLPFSLTEDAETVSELDRFVQFLPGEGAATTITAPGGIFKYAVEGATVAGTPEPHLRPIPFGLPFSVPEQLFHLKWHRVPEEG